MITPDDNTFFTRQFNPSYSWDTGSQFVFMHYQQPDKFMEININKFKKNSFVLKPPELRSTSFKKTDIYDLELKQKESELRNKDKNFSDCPLKKSQDLGVKQNNGISLKDDGMDKGLCFITSSNCGDKELWNITKSQIHGLDFVIDEPSKNILRFKSSKASSRSGYDSKTGHKYVNTETDLCCSLKKY